MSTPAVGRRDGAIRRREDAREVLTRRQPVGARVAVGRADAAQLGSPVVTGQGSDPDAPSGDASSARANRDAYRLEFDYDSDEVTPSEWASLLAWYSTRYGGWSEHDSLRLVPFNRFLMRHDPVSFKTYRRWAETVGAGAGLADPLPAAVSAVLYFQLYIVVRYAQGADYYLRTLRGFGASKAEVREAVAMAFLHGGPPAWNTAAAQLDDMLADWPDEHDGPGLSWPDSWQADHTIVESGIDLRTDGMTPDELAALEEWYEREQGSTPAYVGFFAENFPGALKVLRRRYERAYRAVMPKQMVPLSAVFLAAMLGDADSLRRHLVQARRHGVSKDTVVHLLTKTQEAPGNTERAMTIMVGAAADLLEGWT
jgi:alkylhydroperoxidase/carboxymuconolactone decarboxylase family protein YurZ